MINGYCPKYAPIQIPQRQIPNSRFLIPNQKTMTYNTECAYCHRPLHRPNGLLLDGRLNYCNRTCFHAARKQNRDAALTYVAANIDTESITEMAEHLQISRDALAWRMAIWRKNGLLKGEPRTYHHRPKKASSSEFFEWTEFENDVIVGGNLYPDEVTGALRGGLEITRIRRYRYSS